MGPYPKKGQEDADLINGLSEEERDRSGVYMGTAIASMENGEKLWVKLMEQGIRSLSDEMSCPTA